MSFLDNFLPATVHSTIELMSATVTYKRKPAPQYIPETGTRIPAAELSYSVKVSPPMKVAQADAGVAQQEGVRTGGEPSAVLKQQFECLISRTTVLAKSLVAPDPQTDFIVVGSTVFRVIMVKPTYCGDAITHYKLVLEE